MSKVIYFKYPYLKKKQTPVALEMPYGQLWRCRASSRGGPYSSCGRPIRQLQKYHLPCLLLNRQEPLSSSVCPLGGSGSCSMGNKYGRRSLHTGPLQLSYRPSIATCKAPPRLSKKVVELVRGGSVINGAYPVQVKDACHHFLVSATEVPEIVQLVFNMELLAIASMSEVGIEHKVSFGAFVRHTKAF